MFFGVCFSLLVLCCHLKRFKRGLNGFYMVVVIKYLFLCRLSILEAFKLVWLCLVVWVVGVYPLPIF